jgi:hypothetical protein
MTQLAMTDILDVASRRLGEFQKGRVTQCKPRHCCCVGGGNEGFGHRFDSNHEILDAVAECSSCVCVKFYYLILHFVLQDFDVVSVLQHFGRCRHVARCH